jgi:hypothetical protein
MLPDRAIEHDIVELGTVGPRLELAQDLQVGDIGQDSIDFPRGGRRGIVDTTPHRPIAGRRQGLIVTGPVGRRKLEDAIKGDHGAIGSADDDEQIRVEGYTRSRRTDLSQTIPQDGGGRKVAVKLVRRFKVPAHASDSVGAFDIATIGRIVGKQGAIARQTPPLCVDIEMTGHDFARCGGRWRGGCSCCCLTLSGDTEEDDEDYTRRDQQEPHQNTEGPSVKRTRTRYGSPGGDDLALAGTGSTTSSRILNQPDFVGNRYHHGRIGLRLLRLCCPHLILERRQSLGTGALVAGLSHGFTFCRIVRAVSKDVPGPGFLFNHPGANPEEASTRNKTS